jgi:hypothetical protein
MNLKMKAAGICRRSLSSGFSRFRRSFGADSDFDSVKRYILGQGTEEIKEIKEMSLQRTLMESVAIWRLLW